MIRTGVIALAVLAVAANLPDVPPGAVLLAAVGIGGWVLTRKGKNS